MKSITAIAVVLSVILGNAQASTLNANTTADIFELKSASLIKSEGSELAELILNFQDKERVSGACPLNLVRFEFIDSIRTLLIQLKPTVFCPREDIGQRQGQFKWQLPAALYLNSNLKIILNDRPLSDLKIYKGQIIVKTKP